MYILGRILTVIIALIITIVVICGGYILYLNVNSSRIEDKKPKILYGRYIEAADASETGEADIVTLPAMIAGKTYKALTYNVGYGANDPDFSFFMAEGKTVEGNRTKGLMSRAKDAKTVKSNINSATSLMLKQSPDIALFQEVDKDASRSYHYNEYEAISEAFAQKAQESDNSVCDAYATDFHTGWLLYPPVHPVGQIKDSGILTLSRYEIDSVERRSLPVDESFPEKYFDLDRCFTVARIPVEDAKSGGGDSDDADAADDSNDTSQADGKTVGALVIINVHLSAYDAGLKMRDDQMKMLAGVMKDERDKGNWVVVGGDWNQCFPDSIDAFKNRMEVPKWAEKIKEDALPEGFSIVPADNADIIATCRDTSIPWKPGINYETIIDGWIVSDNVAASSENIDTEYEFSDHNPVLLTFRLNP